MKITHFSEPSEQNEPAAPSMPNRSDLGELYPKAKTYQDHQADSKQREHLRKQRLPARPGIKIALPASLLFAAVMWFIQNLGAMWQTGNMSPVFFSFLLWVILIGLAVLWAKNTNDIFYQFNRPAALFWIIFGITAFVLAATISLWQPGGTPIYSIVATSIVLFIITSYASAYLIKT